WPNCPASSSWLSYFKNCRTLTNGPFASAEATSPTTLKWCVIGWPTQMVHYWVARPEALRRGVGNLHGRAPFRRVRACDPGSAARARDQSRPIRPFGPFRRFLLAEVPQQLQPIIRHLKPPLSQRFHQGGI